MKNKYLKSAVSFMLAGTMLFGLTACSGGAIAEAGSTGKTDKTETSEVPNIRQGAGIVLHGPEDK